MKHLKLFESYINESIDVYHGSTTKFKTFNLSKIGSADGKSLGGWGIYFSDDKNVSDRYYTTGGFVKKYKIEDGSYFDLDDTFYDNGSIIEKLKKKRVKASEIREFETDYIAYPDTINQQVYDWLSQVLGSKKKASLFLGELGYIGTTFKDKWEPDATNYVVFHPKDIIREISMEDDYESEYESVNNNDFIYHGTSKGATLNIQRDGYMKPNNTGEEKPSISFTNDLRYAEYYAKSKGGNDKMVILRTELNNKIFKLSPRIRNNKGDEYITFEKISSFDLEIKTYDGWKSLNKWDVIFNENL